MILVAGGAGFVGSHVAKLLRERNLDHFILDDYSTGHRRACGTSRQVECDLRNMAAVSKVLKENRCDSVMLFAGAISVGESVRDPAKYYRTNVLGAVNLVTACVEQGVRRVVFSSSAAVYGEPDLVPIPESHPTRPKNPYGETKLAVERMLDWLSAAYGLGAVSLRYFNAAGADPDGELGEHHDPEEHLIPLAIDAALRRRPALTIFGDDYATPDGTCIRDYVHVSDLAEAHVAALDLAEAGHVTINLGTGSGHSVKQVVETVERVSGNPVPRQVGPRRAGDPARLVASNALAKTVLGWSPKYSLEDIVRHAYEWRKSHPQGYG